MTTPSKPITVSYHGYNGGGTDFFRYILETENGEETFSFDSQSVSKERNCSAYLPTRFALQTYLVSQITFFEEPNAHFSSGQVYAGIHPSRDQSYKTKDGSGIITDQGVQLLHVSHVLCIALEQEERQFSTWLLQQLYGPLNADHTYDTFPGESILSGMIAEEAPIPYLFCPTRERRRPSKFEEAFKIPQEDALRLKRAGYANSYSGAPYSPSSAPLAIQFWFDKGEEIPDKRFETVSEALTYIYHSTSFQTREASSKAKRYWHHYREWQQRFAEGRGL